MLIDTIHNSNSAITDLVCQNIPSDPKREWEKKSRTMSYFCGVVENEITYQAYTYLYNNGYISQRYCDWGLDGLTMPYFAETDEEQARIINDMNIFARKNTGFQDVEFVVKEFDESEILHDCIERRNEMMIDDDNRNPDDVEEENNIRTFEVVAEEFEKTHCKIVSVGMFAVDIGNDEIEIVSKKTLVEGHEHKTYQKVIEKKNGDRVIENKVFITDWLRGNDAQRRYLKMGLYPNAKLCPPDCLNLWKPL